MSATTIACDENIARIARALTEQCNQRLFGTVTVIFQAGVPERIEIKSGKRVGELK